jgi:hypothetical protein
MEIKLSVLLLSFDQMAFFKVFKIFVDKEILIKSLHNI